jgi:ABC-type maltose transport system permease subunit
MAGATVFALPSIIFFLVLQKYLVSGLAAGAVKG